MFDEVVYCASLMGIHGYTQPSSDSGSNSTGVRRRLARNTIPIKEYGIMNECYCGARAIINTCRSTMDPGRRFFTCSNKWLDEGIIEELTLIHNNYGAVIDKIELFTYTDDFYMAKAEIDQLKQKMIQTEEKIAKLVMFVDEMKKKKNGITSGLKMQIALGASFVMIIALTIMIFK
ncbi:unnamed protein product [Thlaspi arvense]|uniref:Zinc finger GRF-type domain-containing protein n=1 Tax=Thlaspi arvense TaxID=13288 RepID=A0AAU9TAV8_THLAR|nr:unnamed protein product [Thlaspi arvense]